MKFCIYQICLPGQLKPMKAWQPFFFFKKTCVTFSGDFLGHFFYTKKKTLNEEALFNLLKIDYCCCQKNKDTDTVVFVGEREINMANSFDEDNFSVIPF